MVSVRACVVFGTGRHADPFMLTDEVKGALQFLNLPVLGDAIFGKSDFVRGMEKLSKSKLSAAKSVGVAAIRIQLCAVVFVS